MSTIDQPVTKPSLKRRLVLIFTPILIIVGFAVLMQVIIAMNKKPEEKKRPFNTLAVMADYAAIDDVQLTVSAQGEASPQIEIDLVPEVGGKIVYVSPNFLQGGIFRKGETLVRIQDADYQVAVVQAQANVAQAEQVLMREVAEGEIARRDLQDLGITDRPSALALREPQKQQAQASLQAANAQLDSARLQLTRTEVKAPFAGRVRSKSSDIGQYVTPGSRLGRIFSTNIVEVNLALTDNDLSKVDLPLAFVAESRETAPKVKLSNVIAGKRREWTGRLMRTDSTYDTQTRALFAIVEVFDPYGKGASEDGFPLAPGMYVEAEIEGKKFDDVIVIPRDGLRPENKVFIVDDKGKAEIRDVSVLDTSPERAVILSGVAAGELVVLSPMEISRASMTLKALDVNDPSNVLVDPPKPDWLKEREAAEAAGGDEKKKKRRWGRGEPDEEKSDKPLKKKDAEEPESGSTSSDNVATNGDNE